MENGGSSMDYPFLKSAYYAGKLLHASDFRREQEYGSSKLEFINRKFHGWGIIEGLEVQTGQDGSLHFSSGSAIDPSGRILVATEDRQVKPEEIEGLRMEAGHIFILGIRYAEQVVDTESEILKKGESRRPSIIAETYGLKAFEREEFWKLQKETARQDDILTEERVLYENGSVRLAVRVPRVVPADSLFRIRIQVRAVRESNVRIGWRGMAKLQGALFAQSGNSVFPIEEEQAMCSGSFQREWEICTEENRKLSVMLEISNLEIVTGNAEVVTIPTCQFHIETAASYDRTVKRYLQDRKEQDRKESWVPLACLRLEEAAGQGRFTFSLLKDREVRYPVVRPCEEEMLRRIAEENGILDIRWRKLLKHIWRSSLSPDPMPPAPLPPPQPFSPPQPPEGLITEQQFRELTDADRMSRINRGVTVIPVPKRYRKGQVLFSEEIAHGFPGEEVFLWYGRVWEERSYAYWERDRKHYRILHGDEELFRGTCDGQEIVRHAALQNVEAGTFQIAITLNRRWRRKRSKEVAISWTAVRSV